MNVGGSEHALMEAVPCLLCRSGRARLIHRHRGDAYLQWHAALRRATIRQVLCVECGLIYQSPRLPADALDALYQQHYRRGTPAAEFLRNREENARERAAWLTRRLAGALPRTVLEIGCSEGSFLAALRQLGCDVCGVEPSELFAERARRVRDLDVLTGSFHAGSFGERRFELVVCARVLEHATDPLGFLRMIHAKLAPGGRAFIDVPNIYAPWDALAGNFFASPHVVVFSPTTLTAALRLAGFDPGEVDERLVGTAKGMRALARRLEPVPEAAAVPMVRQDEPHVIRALLRRYQLRRWLTVSWRIGVKRLAKRLLIGCCGAAQGQRLIRAWRMKLTSTGAGA